MIVCNSSAVTIALQFVTCALNFLAGTNGERKHVLKYVNEVVVAVHTR